MRKKHMRTHTEEKPYMYEESGRQLSQLFSFKRHMQTHKGATLKEDVLRESAGRCAGLSSGECGTSSGRVRYVLRESAVRPAGECGTFCGSQTFCSSLLEQRKLEVNDLRPACKQDWTGSGCNIKGAGGFC
ncbi:hypothetical protein Bbelb_401280 [Branchiostoma belcheri]|nr:hypothetical protein Bbelb_401280 [Branchiostoma belcheri]